MALVAVALGAVALDTSSVVTATAHRTSREVRVPWTAAYRQEQCLYTTIRAEIPKGAAVYVSWSPPEEAQFLTDLSAGWTVPQESRSSATWVVSVVPGEGCDGLALSAQRT